MSDEKSHSRRSVFISYAHEERTVVDDFLVSLSPVEIDKGIERWDDSMIRTGQHWHDEIQAKLAGTRIAIIFVSRAFLASTYVRNNELPLMLEREQTNGMTIMPVIVEPCRFSDHPILSKIQSVNGPNHTIVEMTPAEKARTWEKLVDDILATLEADATNPT